MKFSMQNMLEQAKKVQHEVEKIRAEVNQKIITAESGGGMVQVTMTGANQIIKIKISDEIINPEEIEMLEDLVVAAVNKAIKETQEMVANEMGKVTSLLPNLPGLQG